MTGNWAIELEFLPALLIVAIQMAAVVHILVSKHENPSQAAFWLLLVTLLPGIGLLGYIFFGITHIEHVHNAILALRESWQYGDDASTKNLLKLQRSLKDFQLSPEKAQLPRMVMLDRLFPDHPALEGNTLEILEDGQAVYPRMLEDIRQAGKSIRLQSYILNSDEVGRAFMDALAERAAAGVDVKVLFDSVGSFKSYFSQYFRRGLRSRRSNFRMKAFSPVNLFAPWRFQLRNHRKLLVVDGKTAYVGGVNISADNVRFNHVPPSRYIHDLHCRITGPAVAQLTMSFLTDYLYTARGSRRKNFLSDGDCTPAERTGDAVVRILPGGPGNVREATRKLFFAAAALAQKELWILTPYFVPGRDYVEALCMAAARGVDVRVVVPAKNNHFYVDCAAQNFYRKLHESGVTIYEKLGYFSHTKALLVDGEWGFMGSSNCDSRSFYLNFELDFTFENSEFTSDILRQFHKEFAGGRKLTAHRLNSVKSLRKLANSIAALFTPVM
ncbi:MAG: cardiolipin synthase [Lentisphaeria bacterium]|nr:cardiolipin synthase [Lentisphaeria bacterium]